MIKMGLNFSSNTANIQQEFMNNIVQMANATCQSTTTAAANNNTIIIDGSKINGDVIGVSQRTQTDASCIMVSSMDNSVSNILSATAQQTNTAATDILSAFQVNSLTNTFNLRQSIINNITQINNATCSASSMLSANNNYIYVGNSTINGKFIGVTQESNTIANCAMTNTMKNVTYNQAQAQVTQSNTVVGTFAILLGIFAAIVGIMIMSVIVLFAFKFFKSPPPIMPEKDSDRDYRVIRELGITPEMLNELALKQ